MHNVGFLMTRLNYSSKILNDLSVCTDDNHSLKLAAYRLVHTDEPYINLHIKFQSRGYFKYFVIDRVMSLVTIKYSCKISSLELASVV